MERKGPVSRIAWLQLPTISSMALLAGLVKPEPCPHCFGTGTKLEVLKARYVDKALAPIPTRDGETFKACGRCSGLGFVHGFSHQAVTGEAFCVCPECHLTDWQVQGLHGALCGRGCAFLLSAVKEKV